MKNKRHNIPLWRRWGARALTLLLACALLAGLAITASARGGDEWQGQIVDPVVPMPVVTIQGNLVTERGKPTGFYELALCVRSGRIITANLNNADITPGTVVSEADYENYLAAHPTVAEDPTTVFDFQYFPFKSASTAAWINTDILTAVNWNLQSVTYETFDAGTNSYPKLDGAALPGTVNYPRGIDPDPAVQGYDPAVLSREDAFPDITTPSLDLTKPAPSVALDVENDPRMFTAEGVAEHFEDNAALITLSASAPDNYPVILQESTPLVVARFSYDLKRFDTTKVSTALSGVQGQRNSITGDPAAGEKGLWMGWDKTTGFDADFPGKQALTWLGQSDAGKLHDFSYSDELAAATQADQTVWVHTATLDAATPDTYFYYYLGAEDYQNIGPDSIWIGDGAGGTQEVKNVTIPATEGYTVLTRGTDQNVTAAGATAPADYTYFKNLLRLGDKTLVVKLVNEPTFKKPTGAGGNIILFYDWDDTLIGSLSVDKGDVRAEVEAYVEENLVHPDLRPAALTDDSGSGGLSKADKLSSLLREYSYRGKYAYLPGGDDATLGAADGKEYPLTNKLDYVFTKRVNTVLTQEENGAKVQYVHPYSLNDPELDPTVWDNDAAEYPYAYGWAVVEDTRAFNGNPNTPTGATGPWKTMHDAAKLKDTWTTVGVGELTDAKPTNALQSATPNGTETRTAPAFLAGADVSWTDGTKGDDYAYTVAGENSYLRFADFSDITAELNRYEGKNTLIVKAVYEPGPELFTGGFYQLVKEPYYNKFSNPAAAAGGAYSVEMTMERATVQRGPIQGVNRVRLPAVRQDTTVDQKWIQDNALGVDHDLDNANVNTAKALTETTFTKVDIDNGEEITFQLSLSARQNKVDYFVIETYGNNFVSGTQRSLTNYEREDDAHTIDNYNYYTEDSDTNDMYFDVTKYDERDGSRGYVLYGTLNFLMQQATRVERGEIVQNDFSRGAGFEVLIDANLRTDVSGSQPDAASALLTMQPKILDAAKACMANPTADTWNFERDYAELSYHQLQYFILGDSVWSDRAAADAKPIAWCHLHASCAAAVSGKPKDWTELVDYAKDATKADGIGELLPGEIETLFGLRKANGAQYTAGADFKADVVAAVNAGCESWAEIQYHILHKTAPADAAAALAEAKTTYWWYNKAVNAPGTPGNLTALIRTTEEYFQTVTLPDGTQESGWTTGLERGKKNFDANDDGDNSTVDRGWKNMTQNLVAKWVIEMGPGDKPTGAESTEKFADWDSFKSELLRVVTIARDAGATPATDSDYWYKAQYLIIHPDETAWPAVAVGDGTTEGDEMAGYWWHNGGTHLFINDLPSMLSVAGLVNDGDETAKGVWDRFKLTDFAKCEDMTDLALSFTGADKIDNLEEDGTTPKAGELDDFKNKILALQKFASNNTWLDLDNSTNANLWKDVQFWLLHEESEVKPGIAQTEYKYYWWEDGGTPEAVTLEGKRGNVESWLNAAFMETYNGNMKAWDNLAADVADGSSSKFNATRLRNPAADDVTPGNTTYQTPDELPMLSAEDVKTKMNALIVEMMTGKTGHATHMPPMFCTWYQVQDYLITGTYTENPSAAQALAWEKQYWWLALDENPDKPQVEVNTEMLELFINTYLQSDTTVNAVTKDALVSNEKGDLNFRKTPTVAFAAPPTINTAKTRLKNFLKYVDAVGQDKSTLTWYQIQWALLDEGNGAYLTPNQAYHKLKDTAAAWAPEWVGQLPEPPAPEPLDYFIKTYLQSATAVGSINKDALAKATLTDGTLGAIELGDLTFRKTPSVAFSAPPTINTAKTRLKKLIADPGVAAQGGVSTLTWYQIQYAVIDEGNGAYKTPLEAYQWAQALPVTWAPPTATTAAVPEGASLTALEDIVPEQPADLSALGELVAEEPKADAPVAEDPKEDVGADVSIGPDAPALDEAPADALPTTVTTTEALPDGGVTVTTVVTGVDGYVTTITTRIPLGGVATTTTVITPPETEEPADLEDPKENVGADVPIGPDAPEETVGAGVPTGPDTPKEDVGGGIPDAPALDLAPEVPAPAPDPDMATAIPETPLGEEAAAALGGRYLAAAPRPVLTLPTVDRRRETVLYFDPRWHGWVQSRT